MVNQEVYSKLNEGLGGAYERIAYSNRIMEIARQRKCQSVLELNATYIAGIPGFNSCILAQSGYDVTVTVHSRDYEDAKHAWELLGLKANLVEWNDDFKTPFKDGEFDLVWNHLAFEHYKHPILLVREMARVSNAVVMTLTLSPFNIGFPLHWLTHRLQRKEWDHGYFKNTLVSTMKEVHRDSGLRIVADGACDAPPWMDTIDAKMGGSMTYLDSYSKILRNRWIWCSADPRCQNHSLVKLMWGWEKAMPDWFRRLVAHHLYVASIKKP